MRMLLAVLAVAAAPLLAAELPTDHTVEPKDTMWDLAGRYYNDHFKWRKIAEANPPPNVHDPHWIYPKQVLHIPALDEAPAAPLHTVEPQPAEPAPAPAPAPKPAPAPAPRVEKPIVVQHPERSGTIGGEGISEDFLSQDFKGDHNNIVGAYPFAKRLQAKAGWKPEGVVLEDRRDGERMLAEGDDVEIRMGKGRQAKVGDQFDVFRRANPTDTEPQNALYLSLIGRIKVTAVEDGGAYKATILHTNSETVQPGDWIKKAD